MKLFKNLAIIILLASLTPSTMAAKKVKLGDKFPGIVEAGAGKSAVYIFRNKFFLGGGITPDLMLLSTLLGSGYSAEELHSEGDTAAFLERIDRSKIEILPIKNGGYHRIELVPGEYRLALLPSRDTRFYELPPAEYTFQVLDGATHFITVLMKMKTSSTFELGIGEMEPDQALPKISKTRAVIPKPTTR
jgi:hypothetical protein